MYNDHKNDVTATRYWNVLPWLSVLTICTGFCLVILGLRAGFNYEMSNSNSLLYNYPELQLIVSHKLPVTLKVVCPRLNEGINIFSYVLVAGWGLYFFKIIISFINQSKLDNRL